MTTPTFTPLTPHVGVRVDGVTISEPLPPATVELLRTKLHTHGLLLFKNVEIGEAEQVRFAHYFGRISKLNAFAKSMPDFIYVSNVLDGGILGDNELTFHVDKMYTPTPPKATMLFAIEIPADGGETRFANTSHAIETMDPQLRQRLSQLKVMHEFRYREFYGTESSKASKKPLKEAEEDQVEQCWHPAIGKHPVSGLPYLTITTRSAKKISGPDGEFGDQDGLALIKQVNGLIDQPANVYQHKWVKGDLIIWDNYLLQHARTPFQTTERRTLRRCHIAHEMEPVREEETV